MRLLTLASLVMTMTACSAAKDSGSATLADGDNRAGKDITVLQAWIGDDVVINNAGVNSGGGAKFLLNPKDCQIVLSQTFPSNSGSGTYDYVSTDCTAALKTAAKLPGATQESPLLNKAIHEYELTRGMVYTHTGRCELVEMRTVMANEILSQPTFDGVGFAYSGTEAYVKKSDLHKVGDVTLKDGRPGSVHRFFTEGFCFGLGGNGGSIYSRKYTFKPYARFVDQGHNYNIWDDVSDYKLGRNGQAWVQSFDRQGELLK